MSKGGRMGPRITWAGSAKLASTSQKRERARVSLDLGRHQRAFPSIRPRVAVDQAFCCNKAWETVGQVAQSSEEVTQGTFPPVSPVAILQLASSSSLVLCLVLCLVHPFQSFSSRFLSPPLPGSSLLSVSRLLAMEFL